MFPDRAKWAAQGPRRPNMVARRRPDLGSISGRAMATCYLRWILSTHSRSTLRMRGFEPSIDLAFANGFFQKGYQFNIFFFEIFLPSWRWSRDTVKMEGFELAATLVATSDFQNFFWGPWRAPGDPPGRGKCSVFAPSLGARLAVRTPSFLQGIMPSRGFLHCEHEAIRAVAREPVKIE